MSRQERIGVVIESSHALLNRGVIAVEGEEARSFLQGLISNDIEKVTPACAIYAALLTPQGKFLFDFFIVELSGRLLLDVEAERLPALLQRLTMYKLRAKVDIVDVSEDYAVVALLGPSVLTDIGLSDSLGSALARKGGVMFVDPRLAALGARAILPAESAMTALKALGLQAHAADDYDRMRFANGVPEGSAELGVDKSPLLECGFEELNGVDFEKGCFVGQELTARMKYRGLVRKRLMPVTFDGEPPTPGTVIKARGRDVGELRSVAADVGFAVIRIDKLKESLERGDILSADGVTVAPIKPAWANF